MSTSIADVLSGSARWAVVCGDNRDILPTIPDRGVDHVITDPPYSEHVHSKSRAGARKVPLRDGNGRLTKCAIDRAVDFGFEHITTDQIESLADSIERMCKRWVLVFSDESLMHVWKGAFVSFEHVRYCFWHKLNGTPQFTGDRPAAHLEAITCMHPPGKKRWNGGGRGNLYPCNVVNQKSLKRDNNTRDHSTQKPLDLMLALVADFTDPGDLILDPFCGLSTTGIAALRLGRRFIGIEKEPKWAELSRERCQAEVENSTLQARRTGQLPLLATTQTAATTTHADGSPATTRESGGVGADQGASRG